MSHVYTLALKEVLDFTHAGNHPVGETIGLGSYPIFDENYRAGLNGKIVDHYFNREIGMETIEMFRLAVRRRMNEVMPYYNKLYLSEKIAFDPLSTIDLRTLSSTDGTTKVEAESDTASDSNNVADSRSVTSDTPQTALSGNGDYATGLADSHSTGTSAATASDKSNSTTEGEQKSESTVVGYQGVASDLLMRYRDSLLNIDLMVIENLSDCFMMVWGNGDNRTTRGLGYYW